MCGLVGFAASGYAQHTQKEFFKQLLFVDTIRGHHATGIAAADTMTKDFTIVKKAMSAPQFLAQPEVDESLFIAKHNFNIYIGHNRWATAGASGDDNNAHPFTHGDIVGAHNGTIRNRTLLEDHKDFVVDSDNIFYHLALHGVEETIKSLDGAYALTWYDKSDNTINFLRNEERPLTFARLTDGSIFWASERQMLEWMVKRHKSLKFASFKTDDGSEDAIFDLVSYCHFKLPFTGRAPQKPELKLYEKPTFRQTYRNTTTTMDDDDDWNGWFNNLPSQRPQPRPQTRELRNSGVDEMTPYKQNARRVLNNFISDGNIGTWLELEFAGHRKERIYSGGEASISIFKYRSWKEGHPVVTLHSFNHAQCATKDWTDADIGKRIYAKIEGVINHHDATAECIKNPSLGASISVGGITEERPPKIYSYCDRDGADVIPFDQAKRDDKKDPVIEEAAKKVMAILDKERLETPKDESETIRFRFGSGDKVSLKEYMALGDSCNWKCECCGRSMRQMTVSSLFKHMWFDREQAETITFLVCSRNCYTEIQEDCDTWDREYDAYFNMKE